jgi:methyltransferase family protein
LKPGGVPRAAFDPCEESPAVARFVERLAGPSRKIPTAIHAADDMYRYNRNLLKGSAPCAAVLYYSKGWQIFQTIQRAAASLFGDLRRTPRLLDFAGGHGRVTRFLSAELDPGRIWISEIHEDAVCFQREYFGVRGFLSSTEPGGFRCETRFPLIVASSFFSHIPPAAFSGWLAALLGCLEPRGLLLFSVLGAGLSSDPAVVAREGSAFVNESETSRLDGNAYGTTYVSEGFVREAVAGARAGEWTVRRFRRALCSLQDLYLVSPAGIEPPPFQPIYLPWGDVDLYRSSPATNRLDLAGWIRKVEEGTEPELVELKVNDRAIATVRPEKTGDCDSRWSFRIDPGSIAPDDVVMAVARTLEGFENPIGLGTPRTHAPEIV